MDVQSVLKYSINNLIDSYPEWLWKLNSQDVDQQQNAEAKSVKIPN